MPGYTIDPGSGLALPFARCGCGCENFYRDIKGNVRCMRCHPPHLAMQQLRKEKLAAIAREQRAVNDFIDEDIDIQDYNYRHHGVRTS